MVLNLKITKTLPSLPSLFCLKIIGEPAVKKTNKPVAKIRGKSNVRSSTETPKSKTLFELE
jgi:hypothetical protein